MEELPTAREGYALLRTTVRDNGSGMSAAFLEKIFDKFATQFSDMYMYLPQEGKDIYICTWIYGDDDESEDDDTFKEFDGKWDGMTFSSIVPKVW